MSKSFHLLLLYVLSPPAWAQIQGRIIDGTKEPVPFANVLVHQLPDSLFVRGTSTDEQGAFQIPDVSNGDYFLRISSIEYQSTEVRIQISSQNARNLGDIVLQNETGLLNEVVVSAQKDLMQQTPFGKVVNVQNSLLTKGSNALQVLERLPGVITDKQNGGFSLNGQNGVSVLINGRRVMMSPAEITALLENTLADQIEQIELITSPSSRYDAEGGAGLINIVMNQPLSQKSRLGLNLAGGHGFGEKAAASVSYQRAWEKLQVTGSYGYLRDSRRSGFAGFGTSHKPDLLGGRSSADFSTFGRTLQNTHNLNFAADYQPIATFSMGTDWVISMAQNSNLSDNNVAWDMETLGYLAMRGQSEGATKRSNLIGSLFIEKSWQQKNRLNLDLSLLKYLNDNPSQISLHYFDRNDESTQSPSDLFTSGYSGKSKSDIGVGIAKVDYERQFNAQVMGTFGGKVSLAKNENNSSVESITDGVWQLDPRSQNLILGKEKVVALYSQFEFSPGQNSTLHAGLRYEYWQRNINTESEPFAISGFFPSVLWNKILKDGYSISLGYNRRISRPLYTDLISNLAYNDPTFLFSGNPLLKPTITNALKLEYNTPWLSSGLTFQNDLHPILRYQITSNPERTIGINSPQNLDYQKSISLFLSAPVQLFDWWKLSLTSTTSLRKYQISYTPNVAAKSYVFQGFNFSSNFHLPYSLELELSGWRNLPAFDGSNRLDGFGIVNLGLAKKLKDDKGIFTLTLPDVLQTMKVHTAIGAMTPLVFDIQTVSDWQDETAQYRVFRISYSRTFGGNFDRKSRDELEEIRRVGR